MADTATITMNAVLLPDEITKTLSNLTYSYTPADANDKWFYRLINVTNSSADLISGAFLSKSDGEATATAAVDIAAGSDLVKFLFIKNTGTTDGSTTTDESIYICFDGGTAAHNLADAIEIGAGESWYGKLPSTIVGNLHAVSGDSGASSSGEGNVQCVVAAIIDDV